MQLKSNTLFDNWTNSNKKIERQNQKKRNLKDWYAILPLGPKNYYKKKHFEIMNKFLEQSFWKTES